MSPHDSVEIDATEIIDSTIEVLVVDDDSLYRDLIKDHLERLSNDITVSVESAPENAITRVQTESIDCVITDYEMPTMDGVELLAEVREDYPNLPVILFTGKGSEEVAAEAIEADVTGYLQKEGTTEIYEQLAYRVLKAVSHRRTTRYAKISRDTLFDLFDRVAGFFVVDEDWRIRYWNSRMADQTGTKPDDALGSDLWGTLSSQHDDLYETLSTALSEQASTSLRTRLNGHWLDVYAEPVHKVFPEKNTQQDLLFVHSRDVTVQIERQQELYRRNQRIQRLLQYARHDLQTPLNVVEGRIELARETADLDHLTDAREALERMAGLIDDLLKIAGGTENLDFQVISLREMAESAWEDCKPTDGYSLQIVDDIDFEGDPGPCHQLFVNVFQNVIDHTDPGTEVRVGGTERGFFIEDDGAGIPEADRRDVLKPGVSREEDGTGLGLAIIELVADVHGWELSLNTGDLGGTRIEVSNIKRQD